jgi:hypothetical protein
MKSYRDETGCLWCCDSHIVGLIWANSNLQPFWQGSFQCSPQTLPPKLIIVLRAGINGAKAARVDDELKTCMVRILGCVKKTITRA